MGVNNLWDLVSPVGRRLPLQVVQGKVLAVDASVWLTQFVRAMRDAEGMMMRNAHLLGFFRRCCKLLFHCIRPVFVFDGQTPALKRRTIERRRSQHEKQAAKLRRVAEKIVLNKLKARALDDLESQKKNKDSNREVGAGTLDGGDAGATASLTSSSRRKDVSDGGPSMVDDGENKEIRRKSVHEIEPVETADDPAMPIPLTVDTTPEKENQNQYQQEHGLFYTSSSASDDESLSHPLILSGGENVDAKDIGKLPAKMQVEVWRKLVQQRRSASRARMINASSASPRNFSREQIKSFLHATSLNRDMRKAQKNLAEKPGEAQMVASDAGRSFTFTKYDDVLGTHRTLQQQQQQSNGNPRLVAAARDTMKAVDQGIGWATRALQAANQSERPTPALPIFSLGANQDDNKAAAEEDEGDVEWEDVDVDISVRREKAPGIDTVSATDATILEGQGGGEEGRMATSSSSVLVAKDDDGDRLRVTSTTAAPSIGIQVEAVRGFLIGWRRAKGESIDGLEKWLPGLNGQALKGSVAALTPAAAEGSFRGTSRQGALPFARLHGTGAGLSPVKEAPTVEDEVRLDAEAEATDDELQRAIELSLKSDDVTSGQGVDTQANTHASAVEISDSEGVGDVGHSGNSVIVLDADTNSMVEDDTEQRTATHADREEEEQQRPTTEAKKVPPVVDDIHHPDARGKIFSQHGASVPGEGRDTTPTNDLLPAPAPTGANPVVVDVDNSISDREAMDEDLSVQEFMERSRSKQKRMGSASEGGSASMNGSQGGSARKRAPIINDLETPKVYDSPDLTEPASRLLDEKNRQESQNTVEEVMAEVGSSLLLPQEDVESMRKDIERERESLFGEARTRQAATDVVSDEMYTETRDMLRMFGIPYLEAPFEAEAQCAWLNEVDLVQGVVTEDSDAFLFGAKVVYKNMFEKNKFVEGYDVADLEREMGLTRSKLISLALLLGSDYTDGVRGVGIVNATEILDAFPGLDGLREFRDWAHSVTIFDREPSVDEVNALSAKEAAKRMFCWKHRNVKRNWEIREGFPSEEVVKAYEDPACDRSRAKFSWSNPDFDTLRNFCWEKFGWRKEKANELLRPLEQELERRSQKGTILQTRIENFFAPERFAVIRSERLGKAIQSIAGEKNSSHLLTPAVRRQRKKTTKANPTNKRKRTEAERPDPSQASSPTVLSSGGSEMEEPSTTNGSKPQRRRKK